MQIETTKEKHSIPDRKTGFQKKLVNSTILGFINQNKILQFCVHYWCLHSKASTQVKLLNEPDLLPALLNLLQIFTKALFVDYVWKLYF